MDPGVAGEDPPRGVVGVFETRCARGKRDNPRIAVNPSEALERTSWVLGSWFCFGGHSQCPGLAPGGAWGTRQGQGLRTLDLRIAFRAQAWTWERPATTTTPPPYPDAPQLRLRKGQGLGFLREPNQGHRAGQSSCHLGLPSGTQMGLGVFNSGASRPTPEAPNSLLVSAKSL